MKWIVLGYQSPFPGAGGATPGYLLETEKSRILIDCGSGVLATLARRMYPHELDGVIVSHLHPDHFSDIWVLQNALLIANRYQFRSHPLPVWSPDRPSAWFGHIQANSFMDVHVIEEDKELTVGDVRVQFFRTDHSIPCYAMKVSNGPYTILYGADSGPKTDWSKAGMNQDLVILEATYLEENVPKNPHGHLSAKQAGRVAEKMKAKRLLLTHLYPEYDHDQVFQEAKEEFRRDCIVAKMGLEINLSV